MNRTDLPEFLRNAKFEDVTESHVFAELKTLANDLLNVNVIEKVNMVAKSELNMPLFAVLLLSKYVNFKTMTDTFTENIREFENMHMVHYKSYQINRDSINIFLGSDEAVPSIKKEWLLKDLIVLLNVLHDAWDKNLTAAMDYYNRNVNVFSMYKIPQTLVWETFVGHRLIKELKIEDYITPDTLKCFTNYIRFNYAFNFRSATFEKALRQMIADSAYFLINNIFQVSIKGLTRHNILSKLVKPNL